MTAPAPALRRDRRAALRRARTRARLRGLAATTAILAGATLLGLGAAGTSYALLTDQKALAGATVSAGTAELRVEGAAAATLPDLAPTPATPAVQAISVTNQGHAPLALSARVTAKSSPALLANALVRVTPVEARANCVAGLGGAQAPLDGYLAPDLGTVDPGIVQPGETVGRAERILCLEVALRPNTPVEQSGQQLAFELGVSGAQAGA